jgi:hypothetical protein
LHANILDLDGCASQHQSAETALDEKIIGGELKGVGAVICGARQRSYDGGVSA